MPSSQSRYAPPRRANTPTLNVRSLYHSSREYLDATYRAFLALPPSSRYLIYFAVGIKALILSIVVYIGPEQMFNTTAQLAIWFGSQPYGAVLLISLVVVVSFPPLIGYGTSITLFGLGWGVQSPATSQHGELKGSLLHAWALASFACLLGASVSFITLRWLIKHHAKRVSWISKTLDDPKYTALSTAVRSKGLSMAILIRFCPFPFAYSNLFFASLNAVSFHHFSIATAMITPKLFLHVWLGTRMFVLMDRDQRAALDGWGKAVNVGYVGVGGLVGIAVSWVVWRETKKVLEEIERGGSGQRGTGEEMPFVLDFGDEVEEEEEQVLAEEGRVKREQARQGLLPR